MGGGGRARQHHGPGEVYLRDAGRGGGVAEEWTDTQREDAQGAAVESRVGDADEELGPGVGGRGGQAAGQAQDLARGAAGGVGPGAHCGGQGGGWACHLGKEMGGTSIWGWG